VERLDGGAIGRPRTDAGPSGKLTVCAVAAPGSGTVTAHADAGASVAMSAKAIDRERRSGRRCMARVA
jgi:hypothetical protein